MRRQKFRHQDRQDHEGHDIIDNRSQHGGRKQKIHDRQHDEQGDGRDQEPVKPPRPYRLPYFLNQQNEQDQKQQDGGDVEKNEPEGGERLKCQPDGFGFFGQLGHVHAQPGGQAIQHKFQKCR